MAIDILQSEGMAPPPQGGSDISPQSGVDILKSEGISPPTQLKPEHKSLIEKVLRDPVINAGVSAGQTLGQALDNVVNMAARSKIPSELTEAASKAGVPVAGLAVAPLQAAEERARLHPLKAPQVAIPGALSTKVGQIAGLGTAFELGGMGGTAALGGLAEAAPGIAKAASVVEKIPKLGKYLPGMAGRAIGAAPIAAALDPKHSLKSAAEMLAISPVADVASAVATPVVRALAAPVIAPLKTGKAAIQKVLRTFFSKDAEPFIKGKFDGIMNDIKGSSSNMTSNEDLFDRVSQHYNEKMKPTTSTSGAVIKKDYVQPGDSVGDAYDLVPSSDPADKKAFVSHIKDLSSQIKEKMAPLKPTERLKTRYQNMLDTLADYKKVNMKTVEDARTLKEVINEHLGDPNIDKKFSPYLRSLKEKGVFNAISSGVSKGSPEAKALLKNADARYKKEIVPFKEIAKNKASPFWQRFDKGKPMDKMGSEYLKPGAQKDQSALLENFLKIAPPDKGATRKLLAYDYMKDVEDNPKKILTKWNKLGPKQKQMLLPEHAEALDQFSALAKKHPAAFEEPKTGGLKAALIKGAEFGGAITLGTHGHLALSALPFIVPSIISAGVKKSFESPGIQKLFVGELAKKGLIDKGDIPLGVNYLRDIMLALHQHSVLSEGKS